MSKEAVKSLILFVLVMISLLLSLLVWNYQPNYEMLYDSDYIGETDIGGEERTRDELILPSKVIFHYNNQSFGYEKPQDRFKFFKELTQWNVYDYEEIKTDEMISVDRSVEIQFPDALPLEYLQFIFSFDESINFATWSFNKILLQMNDDNQSLQLIVPNETENKMAVATIDKTEHYQEIAEIMYEDDKLIELISIDLGEKEVYLTNEPYKMAKKTLVAKEIDPQLFVNALFRNPSLVTQNRLEAVFTDGQRGMRILNDGKTLEYTNPLQTSDDEETVMELIDYTIQNINGHQGWTNDYMLSTIEQDSQRVIYRLAYDGYPVYDFYNISEFALERRSQELYKYDRSLIELGNTLNSVNETLMSGKEVEEFLYRESIDLSEVRDITIGYYLSNIDKHSYILEPAWFILYDDTWRRVTSEESSSAKSEEVG